MMKKRHYIFLIPLFVMMAMLMAACSSEGEITSDEQQPLPEGMGRIRISICTPESNPILTRAVNTTTPWIVPDHDWEKLQTFCIFICDTNNKVVQIITGDDEDMGNTSTDMSEHPYQSAEVTSQPLDAGTYRIYATANYDGGYSVGSTINLDGTVKFANGYSETNIPMTGKLTNTDGTIKEVTVTNGSQVDAGTLTVWRVMAKMQFEFTNETNQQVKILGIEVDPINQASATNGGIYLFSKDNLTSITNLATPNLSEAANDVTATWPLHETMQTQATLSSASLFSEAQLSWGTKLESTGYREASDAVHTKLQKFKVLEKVTHIDEGSAIVFAVKPNSGYTFTPKKLSFKATRGGTGGGHFDVMAIGNGTSTTLATGVRPMRYNGIGDDNPTYISTYEYSLNHSATSGVFYVKIYLYDLDLDKDYAFSDVVITGDVKSIGAGKGENITLPQAALTDVGEVRYEPSTELTLNASGGTGNLFFYVNETDATFTTKENQLSLRFRIQRNGYTEELRYGVTTPYIDGRTGGNGFNVIRRNDWIHIPVHLRDWTFRMEPLAFVPIAGYPAVALSSDALTTTFSTGGYIILQPFAQKNNDGTWRDFSDSEVTFVSLSWKNNDGTNVSGSGKIFVTPLAYDSLTKCITGELNNNLAAGTYITTITVNTKLGPTGSQYDYSFTFNVVLQK